MSWVHFHRLLIVNSFGRFRDDLNYAKELFDARNAQLGTLERLRVGKQLERLSVTSKHQDQDFDPGWLLVTYST